jgi:hypothetical protein
VLIKKIILICLFVLSINLVKSQNINYPICYRKKYVGVWEYKNNSINIRLILRFIKKGYSKVSNTYRDQLVGWYVLSKYGKLLENDYPNSKSNLKLTLELLKKGEFGFNNSNLKYPSINCSCNGDSGIIFNLYREANNARLDIHGKAVKSNRKATELVINFSYFNNLFTDEAKERAAIYWRAVSFPDKGVFKRIN